MNAGQRSYWTHCMCNQEVKNNETWCSDHFLLFSQLITLAKGMVPPTFTVSLPTSVNLIQIIPQWYSERLCLWIPELVKLTILIANSNSWQPSLGVPMKSNNLGILVLTVRRTSKGHGNKPWKNSLRMTISRVSTDTSRTDLQLTYNWLMYFVDLKWQHLGFSSSSTKWTSVATSSSLKEWPGLVPLLRVPLQLWKYHRLLKSCSWIVSLFSSFPSCALSWT